MKEVIYTIPVNEAFDSADGCPVCRLYKQLEATQLDLMLGASMMEPSIRIETNKHGFCVKHFEKMFSMKNRLSLGLILESHLSEINDGLKLSGFLSKDIAAKPHNYIKTLEESCYICSKIEEQLSKMTETIIILWQREKDFRQKLTAQKYFCLPHYKKLIALSNKMLSKKEYEEFIKAIGKVVGDYAEKLQKDVSWFCKKFDYRYDSEPWYDSKDAVQNAIKFISGPTEIE